MAEQDLSALRQQVDRFLKDFKNSLDTKQLILKPHYKNDRTILRLGYTRNQIIDVLYGLTADDYYAGPKEDKLHGGNYWEFGVDIEGCLIYIKIKVQTRRDGTDIPICYSFHDSESPITFPLR